MFCLFYKLRSGRKGQIASLMTVLLVGLVLFAFVSVNLGRLSVQRTRASNAADAGSLAAASAASQLLNYMAGFNASMLLNFSGVVLQSIPAIVAWVLDFITVIQKIVQTFMSGLSGDSSGASTNGYNLVLAVLSLDLSTMTIVLLVEGATKIGEFLSQYIYKLNVKLPENTRNPARQYAFMNAGIDEPKMDFDDWLVKNGLTSSDASWAQYRDEESAFGAFMRTLSKTNKNDGNFNANNMVSFSWQDIRKGKQVDNKVEVYTTPIQPLALRTYDFLDIAKSSSLRSEMTKALSNVGLSSGMNTVMSLAVTMSPMTLVGLQLIRGLMIMLTAVLLIFTIVAVVLLIVFIILCAIPYTSSYGCPRVGSMGSAAGWFTAATNFAALTVPKMISTDPSDIPSMVYGRGTNDLNASVDIRRYTAPVGGALDYGLWQMQYPRVTSVSRALAKGKGGGYLFPPEQDYWPNIVYVK